MAKEEQQTISKISEHLHNILDCFIKSKNEYLQDKEECVRLKEANVRLQNEVQELSDLEKTHRCHLSTSRDIICNLQESLSNLVPFKREIKRLTSVIQSKEKIITTMEEDKENVQRNHKADIRAFTKKYESLIEQVSLDFDSKIKTMEKKHDTHTTLLSCEIAELNSKIAEMEVEHRDKINMVVLEYEERLQRASAQLTQLRDQHAGLIARTDANIDVYRRRIQELEENLKETETKHYVARGSLINRAASPYVPAPYPVQYDSQSDAAEIELQDYSKSTKPSCVPGNTAYLTKPGRGVNPLTVVQIPSSASKPEKKGFSIVKKRKLYSDKDFV